MSTVLDHEHTVNVGLDSAAARMCVQGCDERLGDWLVQRKVEDLHAIASKIGCMFASSNRLTLLLALSRASQTEPIVDPKYWHLLTGCQAPPVCPASSSPGPSQFGVVASIAARRARGDFEESEVESLMTESEDDVFDANGYEELALVERMTSNAHDKPHRTSLLPRTTKAAQGHRKGSSGRKVLVPSSSSELDDPFSVHITSHENADKLQLVSSNASPVDLKRKRREDHGSGGEASDLRPIMLVLQYGRSGTNLSAPDDVGSHHTLDFSYAIAKGNSQISHYCADASEKESASGPSDACVAGGPADFTTGETDIVTEYHAPTLKKVAAGSTKSKGRSKSSTVQRYDSVASRTRAAVKALKQNDDAPDVTTQATAARISSVNNLVAQTALEPVPTKDITAHNPHISVELPGVKALPSLNPAISIGTHESIADQPSSSVSTATPPDVDECFDNEWPSPYPDVATSSATVSGGSLHHESRTDDETSSAEEVAGGMDMDVEASRDIDMGADMDVDMDDSSNVDMDNGMDVDMEAVSLDDNLQLMADDTYRQDMDVTPDDHVFVSGSGNSAVASADVCEQGGLRCYPASFVCYTLLESEYTSGIASRMARRYRKTVCGLPPLIVDLQD
ncbi:hypothetical protein QFC21_001886 [Naganishia friedmannii]|uniref:Uncharacterized protein n=1 Tax=Naganishia friedmannii TaxID=89922 RepID=A0ACC2W2H5_9TREE|nr:hypothetical protein QFC21_001886 [Naganishia friedmannii]